MRLIFAAFKKAMDISLPHQTIQKSELLRLEISIEIC